MDNNQLHLEAKLFKGFADKSRLLILETILEKPKTVSQIVAITKLSQPNTSAHLARLLECGLVQAKQNGRNIFYRISTKEVKKLIKIARKILSQYSKEIYERVNY